MLTTLLLVFLVWLPFATVLFNVVGPSTFAKRWKQALYIALAAPALAANWLTAMAARNQRTLDKLCNLGDWFRS